MIDKKQLENLERNLIKQAGKYVRVKLSSVAGDAGKLLRFSGTGLPGQTLTNIEMWQHYGFVSRPLAGAEGLAFVRGGTAFLVADDDRRYRVEIENGEVALYSDEGTVVRLGRGKVVQVDGADEINLGGDKASLKRLVTYEDLVGYMAALTLPVNGGTAGPGAPPLLEANATSIVRAK